MNTHSAQVRIELHLNGHILPIAQLGPDFIVIVKPFDHQPTDAEIMLRIDDAESRWPVRLVEGISSERRRTRIDRLTA